MLMNDVLPGQQFYHVKNGHVGIRILTQTLELQSDGGLVPYTPNEVSVINWVYPTDEVYV